MVPQGSTKWVGMSKAGKPIITSVSKDLKFWRQLVASQAQQVAQLLDRDTPVGLEATFYLERPKTVKRKYPTTRPDLDKAVRAIGDALTKIIWRDDAQIVDMNIKKRYETPEEPPGIVIRLYTLDD